MNDHVLELSALSAESIVVESIYSLAKPTANLDRLIVKQFDPSRDVVNSVAF